MNQTNLQDVFVAINDERIYQEIKWAKTDEDKNLSDYVFDIDHYLELALETKDLKVRQINLLKAISIGVKTLEVYGLPGDFRADNNYHAE